MSSAASDERMRSAQSHFLTTAEVAPLLRCSLRTLHELMRRRSIPPSKDARQSPMLVHDGRARAVAAGRGPRGARALAGRTSSGLCRASAWYSLERRRDKFGADFALTIDHSLRPFGETIDNTQPATGQPLLVRRQSNRDLPRTRRVAHEDAEPPAETVFALQSLADDDGLSHCSSLE